jgi:hypothetical protein
VPSLVSDDEDLGPFQVWKDPLVHVVIQKHPPHRDIVGCTEQMAVHRLVERNLVVETFSQPPRGGSERCDHLAWVANAHHEARARQPIEVSPEYGVLDGQHVISAYLHGNDRFGLGTRDDRPSRSQRRDVEMPATQLP